MWTLTFNLFMHKISSKTITVYNKIYSRETIDLERFRSFPNAKVAENHVQNILHVHPPGQPAQSAGGHAEFLGDDVLTLLGRLDQGSSERLVGRLEHCSLSLSGYQRWFRTEIFAGITG